MTHRYAINDLYKLINNISNRAFIFNNVRKFNNKGIRLIKAQISKVSRFVKVNNVAKSRDFKKSRDIRLKEHQYKSSNKQLSN